jgi:hypothetical protein
VVRLAREVVIPSEQRSREAVSVEFAVSDRLEVRCPSLEFEIDQSATITLVLETFNGKEWVESVRAVVRGGPPPDGKAKGGFTVFNPEKRPHRIRAVPSKAMTFAVEAG